MKIQILSDLHTEFTDFSPPDVSADIVILAGDIGVGLGGLDWAVKRFGENPVIYVPGNHEFYRHSTDLVDELRANAPANIYVLDNDVIELFGVRFLGATLWTDFELFGDAEFAMHHAASSMNDFVSIRHDGRIFTPADSVELHWTSKRWLNKKLRSPFVGPTVVVTHHLPAAGSIAKRYASDPLSAAFGSRLEDVIRTHSPELWIHGHTHVPCDYVLGSTRVVCNPRGYPGESDSSGFNPALMIEL